MKKLIKKFNGLSLKRRLLIIGAVLIVVAALASPEPNSAYENQPATAEETQAKPAPKKESDSVAEVIKDAPLAAAEFVEIKVNDHAGTPEDGDKIAVVFFEQTGVQNCNSIRLNIANVVNEAFRGAEELSEITVKGRVDGTPIVWLSITRDEYEKESDGYLSKKDIIGLPGYGEAPACK